MSSPTAPPLDLGQVPDGMTMVPGATFRMGDERFYPEEGPVHAVAVDGFWIDEHPVTTAEFARFVDATGHVTAAELAPDPAGYPDADPALLVPGSAVFQKTAGPVDVRDVTNWWRWTPGASWRHPDGPGSDVAAAQSLVAGEPGAHIPRRVIKGGSYLCAPSYCLRFRPAARQSEAIDTSTGHIGFRCVLRAGAAQEPQQKEN